MTWITGVLLAAVALLGLAIWSIKRHKDPHLALKSEGPIETLRVLGSHRVAYLDRIGSGAETAAHLRDDGRITIMLCAFEGPPRIVRLHGRGSFTPAGDRFFAERLTQTGLDAVNRLPHLLGPADPEC